LRRRTFLAALPAAAAGAAIARSAAAQTPSAAPPLSPSLAGTRIIPASKRATAGGGKLRHPLGGVRPHGAAASSHPLGTLAGIEI
jgi:gamma-glutamyltranspeptidase/glutathione hydrolase